MTMMTVIVFRTPHIYRIDFQLKADYLFQFCVFRRKITYRHMKIGFSRKKKMLSKKCKTCQVFETKLKAQVSLLF